MLKHLLLPALFFLDAQAGNAWILTLEYKQGNVTLISKKQTDAQLKQPRHQPNETEFIARHSSEFGFILRSSDGQIIKTQEGHLPGKIHADFAQEGSRHYDEHFTTVDTFQVIIPAQEGSSIEFLSREPQHNTHQLYKRKTEKRDSSIPLPLRSAGSINL